MEEKRATTPSPSALVSWDLLPHATALPGTAQRPLLEKPLTPDTNADSLIFDECRVLKGAR